MLWCICFQISNASPHRLKGSNRCCDSYTTSFCALIILCLNRRDLIPSYGSNSVTDTTTSILLTYIMMNISRINVVDPITNEKCLSDQRHWSSNRRPTSLIQKPTTNVIDTETHEKCVPDPFFVPVNNLFTTKAKSDTSIHN